MFTRQVKSFLMLEISIFTLSFAFTQNPLTATGVLRDDRNRPVNAISKDLDVTPDLFRPALATSIQPLVELYLRAIRSMLMRLFCLTACKRQTQALPMTVLIRSWTAIGQAEGRHSGP
jgi:hypothetical protein